MTTRSVLSAFSRKTTLAIALASAFGLGAAATYHVTENTRHSNGTTPEPSLVTQAHAVTTPPTPQTMPDFAALVQKTGAAVVNITTVQKPSKISQLVDPRLEMLRRFGFPVPDLQQQNNEPARGVGSGFIISNNGYLLTNAHVVDGADEVTVRLTDRREFRAKVVGVDTRTDIAVLKIDATNLPYVNIGNPSQTLVGDWVAAIGSPFGFENTVTAGIVSAKSRALPDDSLVPFIQTDVAVNPGNSGGPLFNLNGEVVGINSQIYSRSGGFMGLSFAIPIDLAMQVTEQIKAKGYAQHARLGVSIQPVNKELADSFGLDKPRGALVNSVDAKSPAQQAGLRPGDVVLSVDNQPVDEAFDLPKRIGMLPPGQTVTLKIWRERKLIEISAKLAEQPRQNAQAEPTDDATPMQLGMNVRPLTQDEKAQLGTQGGLLVGAVQGPAARAGIRAGDALLSANGQSIHSAAQLSALASKAGGRVALLIQRGEARLFVPIDVS